MDDIADFMRKRWEKRGFPSMRKFCEACDVPAATLSLALAGKRSAPHDHVEKWAEMLGLMGNERVDFVATWHREKAKAQRGAAGYLESLEARCAILEQRLRVAAAMLRSVAHDLGPEISPKLQKRIKAFSDQVQAFR